tara:strand:- start:1055 stop:1900 length:846 start_codon:yes stop_codon:yes gene_type:complete
MASFAKQYESFDDVLRHVTDESAPTWEGRRASQDAPEEWSGDVTLDQAVKLAEFGWKDGRDRMSTELDMAHNATSFERLPSFDYDVAGYMPNIPLYVSGCPSHMMSPLGNESSMGRVVEFKVNLSASSRVSEETLMRRGASILSLIDKLEDSGMSCAITLCEYTKASYGKGQFLIEFPIKKAGQPLDIDRCAYAMVHPSMLRKICFALTELEPKAEEGWSSGYGRPDDLPYHMRHGCVYFPQVDLMSRKDYTMADQMARTIKMYEHQTQGLDFTGEKLEDK